MDKKIAVIIMLGLTVLSFSGCITTNFSKPIVPFQQSINKSSFIIANYYEKVNDFEREVYLNECLFNPEKELLLYDNGKPTPLLYETLSPKSIKARTDALILIGIYANRLGELANNDSPEIFCQNTIELGDNLKNLGKTFADFSNHHVSAMEYSGPTSKIISLLGEMYLESSKEKIIEDAIKMGTPAVNSILDQLRSDLNHVIIPLQTTGLKQKIVEMSVYYNEHRKKLTLTRRRTELSKINNIVKEYNSLINLNPSNLIQEMKQTNRALIKYVGSPKTPKSLAEFVSVLERFNRDVQLFAGAIKEI